MKRIKMTKILSLAVLAVLIATVICSCGKQEPQTGTKQEPQTGTITPAQSFDNAGFTEICCERSGDCKFTANDISVSSDITWKVFLFTEKFDDAPRYIPQAKYQGFAELSSDASVAVKKGNYLYVYCSENAFTLDSREDITKGAEVTYTIQ